MTQACELWLSCATHQTDSYRVSMHRECVLVLVRVGRRHYRAPETLDFVQSLEA